MSATCNNHNKNDILFFPLQKKHLKTENLNQQALHAFLLQIAPYFFPHIIGGYGLNLYKLDLSQQGVWVSLGH